MTKKNHLTQGLVTKKLISLSIPMVFGLLSMVIFNLVDAFFISRLGIKELAAIGFTFPVIMFFVGIILGFGVAASSVVSRAIGRGDHHQVQRLTTDSIIISLFIMGIATIFGLLSIDWLFRSLGANNETLPLIKQYMNIWYLGIGFIVIPMVGNNALRACGDMLFPSLVMIISTIVNIILDPLLIFGLWGFPQLGLKGAAIATVVARATAMVLSLLILHFKEKLIDFSLPTFKEFSNSIKQISYLAIPSAASRLLMPLTMSIIMRLVANLGPIAIAAFGVAVKIEMFAFLLIMALATALVPFVGQNWGAKNFNRVKEAIRKSNTFSLLWGLGTFIVLLILAIPLGNLFGGDIQVARYITLYLWIIPISYGLRGCVFLTASVFNAINKPLLATGLNLTRMFAFHIPLAIIGIRIAGLIGLFVGLCLANIGSGILSLVVEKLLIKDDCSKVKINLKK
ncbi:MAG: MATE family efflux transporter [Candidatus Susulua stagnicola]|nr:MATE family efflux transporter [Candidatus Susulua stagnicola]